MKWISAAVLLFALSCVGCGPKADDANNAPAVNAAPAGATSAAPTPPAGGGGVNVVSPAAGGMSPVTGTQDLQGASGGAMGQAAKDMARTKTANMGAGSMSQMPAEGN